jgi:hypothetical protein
MALLKATLELSPRIGAKLRSAIRTCLALQAGDECILCWKLRSQDATILKGHLEAIETHIVMGDDYESAFAYVALGIPGWQDFFSLARLNRDLTQNLARQTKLKIFTTDEALDLASCTRIEIEWGDRHRSAASRAIQYIVEARSEGLSPGTFLLAEPQLRARYQLKP